MRVLNLYACLGGNRLLWEDCEVTAVELDPELARMYQERFPDDTVIVGDVRVLFVKVSVVARPTNVSVESCIVQVLSSV